MWRGDDVDAAQIRDEIADIRLYLEHLSRHLQIDVDSACDHKLDEVADRLAFKEMKESAYSS